MVDKSFIIVYDLKINFSKSINLMYTLLKDQKDISRITFILMSAIKKVSLMNWSLLKLF